MDKTLLHAFHVISPDLHTIHWNRKAHRHVHFELEKSKAQEAYNLPKVTWLKPFLFSTRLSASTVNFLSWAINVAPDGKDCAFFLFIVSNVLNKFNSKR